MQHLRLPMAYSHAAKGYFYLIIISISSSMTLY